MVDLGPLAWHLHPLPLLKQLEALHLHLSPQVGVRRSKHVGLPREQQLVARNFVISLVCERQRTDRRLQLSTPTAKPLLLAPAKGFPVPRSDLPTSCLKAPSRRRTTHLACLPNRCWLHSRPCHLQLPGHLWSPDVHRRRARRLKSPLFPRLMSVRHWLRLRANARSAIADAKTKKLATEEPYRVPADGRMYRRNLMNSLAMMRRAPVRVQLEEVPVLPMSVGDHGCHPCEIMVAHGRLGL